MNAQLNGTSSLRSRPMTNTSCFTSPAYGECAPPMSGTCQDLTDWCQETVSADQRRPRRLGNERLDWLSEECGLQHRHRANRFRTCDGLAGVGARPVPQ